MEKYIVTELNEDFAKEICSWRYEGDYSVYNFPEWNIIVANGLGLSIKKKRQTEFIAILINDELIAYGRIRLSKGKSFIGVGLKPSWCGKGYGGNIIKLLIKESQKRLPNYTIALQVRSFNKRAINCYKRNGFQIKDKYVNNAFNGKDEFIYMEYIERGSNIIL